VRRGAVAAALLTLLVAAAPASAAKRSDRVVALTPFAANTVASLGVRPVGIGQVLGGHDRFVSELTGVPQLPLSHPNGPNMEQLVRLRPDLVLTSPTWVRGTPSIKRLGPRVVDAEPRSVADVPVRTREIGRLLGKAKRGRRVAARRARRIKAASEGITTRPTVLLVLGVGRTPYAFLPNSWGGDVVTRAGGRLLTEGLSAPGGFARISDELVVARNPDVIIAVPHGNPEDLPRLTEYLETNPAWSTTTAARTGQIHISLGNSLLQPWTDVDATIRDVRTKYLGG
jgi:iron complex transport system substrate-binding protein